MHVAYIDWCTNACYSGKEDFYSQKNVAIALFWTSNSRTGQTLWTVHDRPHFKIEQMQ